MNQTFESGSSTFVALRNQPFLTMWATCSRADWPALAPYRWRFLNDGVTTTKMNGNGYEAITPMANVVLGLSHTVQLHYRDGNPLNVQRRNLSFSPRGREPNTILHQARQSLILLGNAQTVVIDKNVADRVTSYRWRTLIARGKLLIVAAYTESGKRKRLHLDRFLLGLKLNDPRTVVHKNGDPYDHRQSNLIAVRYRHG